MCSLQSSGNICGYILWKYFGYNKTICGNICGYGINVEKFVEIIAIVTSTSSRNKFS